MEKNGSQKGICHVTAFIRNVKALKIVGCRVGVYFLPLCPYVFGPQARPPRSPFNTYPDSPDLQPVALWRNSTQLLFTGHPQRHLPAKPLPAHLAVPESRGQPLPDPPLRGAEHYAYCMSLDGDSQSALKVNRLCDFKRKGAEGKPLLPQAHGCKQELSC